LDEAEWASRKWHDLPKVRDADGREVVRESSGVGHMAVPPKAVPAYRVNQTRQLLRAVAPPTDEARRPRLLLDNGDVQ